MFIDKEEALASMEEDNVAIVNGLLLESYEASHVHRGFDLPALLVLILVVLVVYKLLKPVNKKLVLLLMQLLAQKDVLKVITYEDHLRSVAKFLA